jgi:hypothetical protein
MRETNQAKELPRQRKYLLDKIGPDTHKGCQVTAPEQNLREMYSGERCIREPHREVRCCRQQ